MEDISSDNPQLKRNETQFSPADTDRLVQVQKQRQKILISQMEQRKRLFVHMDKREKAERCSVKLPRFELSMFYGNKHQCYEFWDASVFTVHRNVKLLNI